MFLQITTNADRQFWLKHAPVLVAEYDAYHIELAASEAVAHTEQMARRNAREHTQPFGEIELRAGEQRSTRLLAQAEAAGKLLAREKSKADLASKERLLCLAEDEERAALQRHALFVPIAPANPDFAFADSRAIAANETLRRARCVVADALREVESARAGFFRSDEAFHSAPAGDWIGAADGADIYAGEEFFNPGVLCLSIWLCCFLLAVLLPPSLPH